MAPPNVDKNRTDQAVGFHPIAGPLNSLGIEDQAPPGHSPLPKRGRLAKIGKLTQTAITTSIKWSIAIAVALTACYLLIGGVGAWIPTNSQFAPSADGIEIFIFSGDVHSDLILPIKTDHKDWLKDFDFDFDSLAQQGIDTDKITHIAFGWGEKNFYTETPLWSDLQLSTAAAALFTPTSTVMHVKLIAAPQINADVMRTKLSVKQYRQMVDYIAGSFAVDLPSVKPIPGVAYGAADQFFPAAGDYHAFRTCNCWTGDAMRAAGIRVGRFTPLPKTVFWHLPPY